MQESDIFFDVTVSDIKKLKLKVITVHIHIYNVSPRWPNNPIMMTVHENIPPGSFVGVLKMITIGDENGSSLYYNLIDNANILTVNHKSGVVRTKQELDYENVNILSISFH